VVIAIFDIDGVVADVRHRLHHLHGWNGWSAFFDDADSDPLLDEGARLVADLAGAHEIVWLTGRPEWLRSITEDWFARHQLPGAELHMRPNRDYRPARVFKLDVLRGLQARGIAAFVDDDAEVIEAALSAGVPAVLADWIPRDGRLRDAQEHTGRT
jgi:phosphoglycolate phosphatase-like HAD superfamily hydrolase